MASTKSSVHRMGLASLTIMTASNMMGSGVFMLPSSLANIGFIAIFGCFIAAFGILMLALTFAKISELHPCKGGVIASISLSFGSYIGLQTSLFYWLSTWVGNCALLITGVGYLSYFFPELKEPFHAAFASIAILWCFVLLGLQGAKVVGYAQIFTGLCMLTVIISISFFSWHHFSVENYISAFNVSGKSNTNAIIDASLLALWGFLGIESASVSTEQVTNPKRNIPLATLLGLVIVTICYLSSNIAITGILPHSQLIVSTSPFADTARFMWGNTAGQIISALAVIACLGAMPGWQILQTEVPRAAAEEGLFPQFFAKTNKQGVPYKGMIFTAILMSAILLLTISPNLEKQFRILIVLSISATLLPYAFAIISLPVIWIKQKEKRNTLFILYICFCAIGFIFVCAALLSSGSTVLFWGMALQLIMIPLYLLYVSRQKEKFKPL